MEKIIEVSGLKKSYGPIEAVRGIDFYVERGSLFAFLGPNGAGKSTTINIIDTLLKSDGGEVIIDGYKLGRDDAKIRSLIGTVFQEHVLDDLLTVRENILVRGSFYHSGKRELYAAVDYAAEITGVMGYFNRPYGKLSGGQRRRTDIARALVNKPKILILDEPTTGLDPQTRENVWEAIERLRSENDMTIFLTTHYMEEAGKSDYVVVIDDGVISAKGTPARLKEQYSSDYMILHTDHMDDIVDFLKTFGLPWEIKGDTITLKLKSTMEALPILERVGDSIRGFQVIEGDMDDAFINITGREMRE